MDKLQEAINLMNQGNIREAAAAFERMIKENPADVAAFYNLGLCFIKLREPTHAIAVLSRSLALDSGRASTLIALGDAYLLIGDPRTAKNHLVTALGMEVDNPYALRKLGIAYGQLGDRANSAYCLKKSYDLNPRDSDDTCGTGHEDTHQPKS